MKTIFVFSLGILLGGIIVALFSLAMWTPVLSGTRLGSLGIGAVSDGIAGFCRTALSQPLETAGQEIEDEDIARFYQHLLDKLELGDQSEQVVSSGAQSGSGGG